MRVMMWIRMLPAVPVMALIVSAATAQVATTLEQAESAGLSLEKRTEVQARAINGTTVSAVLTTMLLNNVRLKHSASRIAATDFNRGVVVAELVDGKMTAIGFDTTTLAIRS